MEPVENNCGAGSRSIVFDPEGKVRPCAMFPEEFSGTVLFKPDVRSKITEIISPRKSICGDCEFLNYCAGCFLRGWVKCKWGHSQKVEEVFRWLKS